MSELMHIISWERFCEKEIVNDLEKYAEFLISKYPGLLDVRNLNTKNEGPLLKDLPENFLSKLIEKSISLLESTEGFKYIRGVDMIFKLLCLVARNCQNVDKLIESGTLNIVLSYMDVAMEKLFKETDTEWLNLFEFLLYFLEIMYDPTFSWRYRKRLYYSETVHQEDCNQFIEATHINNEVLTWICSQLSSFRNERDIHNRLLHLLCSILSGSKYNAQLLISPAIIDTFTFEFDPSAELIASYCFLILCLSDISLLERQEDLSAVVTKMITFIKEKLELHIHEFRCLTQLSCVNRELSEELIKCDIVGIVERCLANMDTDNEIIRLCFIILGNLTAGPCEARQQFIMSNGYEKILEILTGSITKCTFLLDFVFSWSVCCDFDASKVFVNQYTIRDGYVVVLLVKWSTNLALVNDVDSDSYTETCDGKSIVNWKAIVKLLMEICHKSRSSTNKCCQSAIISAICDCIKMGCQRLDELVLLNKECGEKVVLKDIANLKRKCEDLLNGLFHLLEMFASFSISGNDLVSVIRLFNDKHSKVRGRRIVKMLNTIVSGVHNKHDVNCWFELSQPEDCISISPRKDHYTCPLKPNMGSFQLDRETISQKILSTMAWKMSTSCFSFHCWLNLSPFSARGDSDHERSCIFRLLTENCNGFEAFLNVDGQLVVGTCHQGEFRYVQVTLRKQNKTVSLEERLLKFDKWHMLDLVFQNSSNFFGKSTLAIYIDGVLINNLDLKYPQMNENIAIFHVGGRSKNISNKFFSVLDRKYNRKSAFPGNDIYKRSWIGDIDRVWGKLGTLKCRIAVVTCLNDILTDQIITSLYEKGPMDSHAIFNEKQLSINIIINYHPLAFDPVNNSCLNLHPYIQSSNSNQYHCGYLEGERLSSLKLEIVINEIGGVMALLPIIENLNSLQSCLECEIDNKDGYRFEDFSSNSIDNIVSMNGDGFDFILLQDNNNCEHVNESIMTGIVILLRKISLLSINQHQIERTKCIEIIGVFLQYIEVTFLDMNVVIVFHALADQCKDSLRCQIYQWILMDWRIWSRCSIDIRHKHCKFIEHLVKNEGSFFRNQYGVGFFLNVLRLYHCPNTVDGIDECKNIRQVINEIIYNLVHKYATNQDYKRMVKFIHECNEDLLIQDILALFTRLFESSTEGDQDCILLYESKLMESLFVLLIRDLSIDTKGDTIKFLHLIITSYRVKDKYKDHLLLTDISFASIFIYKEFYESPISPYSIQCLLHILKKAAAKDLFGVIQFLSLLPLSPIDQIINAMIMLKSFFDKSPDAIFAISQQPCWQDILIHLLVSKKRVSSDSSSQNCEVLKQDELTESKKDLNVDVRGFRRTSTWAFDESLNDKYGFLNSKFDEIAEEEEDFSYNNLDKSLEGNSEEKSSENSFLRTISVESKMNMNLHPNQRRSKRSVCNCSKDVTRMSIIMDGVFESKGNEDLEDIIVNPAEQLIDLTLDNLHVVIWSVLTSANNELAWMTVHQVMESLRSVNERYLMLKPMFYFKQRILIKILQSTIDSFRNNESTSPQNLVYINELIRLIVDCTCLISTEPDYEYEAELLNLTIVLLQDYLNVWAENSLYPELAALGFHYLLTLSCCQDPDIVSEVCAKLHFIITTLSKNTTYDEIAFILVRLDQILKLVINNENYYFTAPILKTILEQHADILQISMYLVNLDINNPEFYDFFKEYFMKLEWKTFIKSRLCSACEIYESSYLNDMVTGQSLWRAQANEQTSLDRKKRVAVTLIHKALFENEIINLTLTWIKDERRKKNYYLKELQSHQETVVNQWKVAKQFLMGSKGCWRYDDTESILHLKQSCRENSLRMRPIFEINHQFESHVKASMERDNPRRSYKEPKPDPLKCFSALEGKIDLSDLGDDQLGDDEWISIQNIEQQYPNKNGISSPKMGSGQKICIFECRCKLVTFTEVFDGKFELTTSHLIFQGNRSSNKSLDCNTSNIMFSINQIREVHLRRYNLRRSALEIFLTDQRNYFFNFDCNMRDKVYSKIFSLRPPNLVYSKQRSPADLLKSSNLTQKWVNREISNFEYLMQLNTIAGRTYNDLSQYPVFPWIISDYTSPKLDLNNPKTFRDLSRPIGVVNAKNEHEVREKYEGFEDPCGVIAKFHYGTHYSSAAGVQHFLVRMEPYTTMHIELQSGKFDVADRQFHSIALAWDFIMESPNDNKELIPEFFYQPQFLKNENNFDFGFLQQTQTRIDNVELPAWASSPEDFIYQHRQALESEHVSMNLHNWIDLIFGYKQKGIEAVNALNVFYYVTYEGVIDLDLIEDPVERESIESMINNFGQTPCQLLKTPHPRRMSLEEVRKQMIKVEKYLPVLPYIPFLKHTAKSICCDLEPITYVRVPCSQTRSFVGPDRSLNIITIHSSNIVAKHNWIPSTKGSASSYFIEIDPVFDSPIIRRRNHLGNLNSFVKSSNQLYAVTPDCKYVIAGGNINNRLTIMSLTRRLDQNSSATPHHGPISCVSIDIDSMASAAVSITNIGYSTGIPLLGMSGSLDSTCVLWDWSDLPAITVLHMLYGHCKPVVSVSLSVYLDIAVSGSQDGSVNLYSITNGQFLHTIIPGGLTSSNRSVNFVLLNRLGHVYIQWQNGFTAPNSIYGSPCPAKYPKQFLSLYSVHTNHMSTNDLGQSKITVVSEVPKQAGSLETCVLVGNLNGELSILDGYYLTDLNTLKFSNAILDANIFSQNGQYLSVALSNGQLIISTVSLASLFK